jgi:hypothetical protein
MLDLLDLAQTENKKIKINEVIENSFRVISHYAEKKSVKLVLP